MSYFSVFPHADNLYKLQDVDISLQNETINKQITVSTICIMETIKTLKIKRAERNKIVQLIIRIVSTVMNASRSESGVKIQTPNHIESANSAEKLNSCESKLGILDYAENNENPLHIMSTESLPCGELSGRMSVLKKDVEVRMADVSNEIYTNKSEAFGIDPLGSSDLLPDWSKRVFSATLRENMERNRAKINSVQRKIRELSEKGQLEEVEELIFERTALAVGSISMATELYEQIHYVRAMQETRQKTLTSALSEIESFSVGDNHTIVSPLKNHGDLWFRSPATLSRPNSEANGGSGPIPPTSSSSPSVPISVSIVNQTGRLNTEQCSWSGWIDTVDACTVEVTAVDPRSADSSIQLLKSALDDQTKIASRVSKWLNDEESDSLNSIDNDTCCDVRENIADSNDNTQNDTHKNKNENENLIKRRNFSLAEQYEENIRELDKCRMLVKCAVDVEIENIVNQIPDTKITEMNAFSKGCGVLNHLILQNRSDIIDTISLEKEIDDWLEVLTALKNPIEVRSFFCMQNILSDDFMLEVLMLKGYFDI